MSVTHCPQGIAQRCPERGTIYKSLFIQARGVLKEELMAHLRSRRIMRRGKTASTSGQPRGQIINAVSIRDRPAEIEDRAVPGHWEGDLLSGTKNSHIATLVERTPRFVMLVQVGGKVSNTVVDGLIRQVGQLPKSVMASLTWDRGTELAVTSREVVRVFLKQFWFKFVPVFHGLQGRSALKNRLWELLIIEQYITVHRRIKVFP
jgi:IS30 family transposase